MIEEKPYIPLSQVCGLYGLTFRSAKNAILLGTFPVPTYKVRREIVIDREVHKSYFEIKRKSNLRALKNNQKFI